MCYNQTKSLSALKRDPLDSGLGPLHQVTRGAAVGPCNHGQREKIHSVCVHSEHRAHTAGSPLADDVQAGIDRCYNADKEIVIMPNVQQPEPSAPSDDYPDDVEIVNEEDEVIPLVYSITSYGADFDVEGLVRRMKDGHIRVPQFQRGYVWSLNDASRFVESLLLGLPVPGIFLSKEHETQRMLVIDGQQRLRTLQFFFEGIFAPSGREFALKGVQSQYEGLTVKSLSEADKARLRDSIIHATIVKQDEPSDDDSSIYHIFERLNTGGRTLAPQEIRACIFHGQLNDFLHQLNEDQSWRGIFGNVNRRMRDEELILRFLALYFWRDTYTKPMKGFLNKYMKANSDLTKQSAEQLHQAFIPAVTLVLQHIGKRAFRPKGALNAAVYDSVMIGNC